MNWIKEIDVEDERDIIRKAQKLAESNSSDSNRFRQMQRTDLLRINPGTECIFAYKHFTNGEIQIFHGTLKSKQSDRTNSGTDAHVLFDMLNFSELHREGHVSLRIGDIFCSSVFIRMNKNEIKIYSKDSESALLARIECGQMDFVKGHLVVLFFERVRFTDNFIRNGLYPALLKSSATREEIYEIHKEINWMHDFRYEDLLPDN